MMAQHETRDDKLRAQIGSGFYYSDFPSSTTSSSIPQLENQMRGFEPNPELFNLQSGIEMLGFPWKNLQQRERTTTTTTTTTTVSEFISKLGNVDHHNASSSKTVAVDPSSNGYYQSDFRKHDFGGVGFSETTANENLMAVAPDSTISWQENNNRFVVDDSSLRCVFPCEGSERPQSQNHGLSLSLCPNKVVSSAGLQSFELRESINPAANDIRFFSSNNSGDEFFGKSMDLHQISQLDGRSSYPSIMGSSSSSSSSQLKNSKYLRPTQELLNEFCNLGSTKQNDRKNNSNSGGSKNKLQKTNQWDEAAVSSKNQSLHSLDFLELQKRKVKLLTMLEEVDRRYRQYSEQMRSVVSSFEGVAGAGAASVYSSLALKAMSRHFRCLRDGIVGQIQVMKKAMGEKDAIAPGTTKGETPRLKLLDQTLRQQRALQQMGMMESHPWRPQRGLPERSVSVLRAWLFEHFLHPYPSDVDKHILARQTGLSRSQVSNWFINARVRLWKPMVEEMYLEETKEQDNKASDGGSTLQDNGRPNPQHLDQNPNHDNQLDQKPSPGQLAEHDHESLSSIINSSEKRDQKEGKVQTHQQQRQFARPENFGMIDLDFSNYSHPAAASTITYGNRDCANPSFGGGGVSLTLGLQQHNGGGMSLSFSPSSQHSLFFSRQHMEECPSIQYSMLDGETQNLPYRNLMGAQLLHDLAG